MNGRYFILPRAVYVDKYLENERVFVDDMNNIQTKKGKQLDSFHDMLFERFEDSKGLLEGLREMGQFDEEKGQLFVYRDKNGRNIFMFNSIDEIEKYHWNSFKFVDMLFESREELLSEKISSYLTYVYRNNLDSIKNLASITTIKDRQEFIQSLGNREFIRTKLQAKDSILLREIYFLLNKHFFGFAAYTHVYTFLEENGRLIPIRFEDGFSEYLISDEPIDKVEVILSIQKKQIANLLHEKIENKMLFSKKEYYTKDDLQAFYNKHIGINR